MVTDEQLDILHDHYKETFARVRESERSRDRLFLWVIGLYALLALEIGYPASIAGTVEKISILGAEFDLHALPLAALLTASWVMTFAITLRYCQVSMWISRHYAYVHCLEEVIAALLDNPGGGIVYRREGKAYLDSYPAMLNVAWIAYDIVFPIILLVSTIFLVVWEWNHHADSVFYCVFDSLIAAALAVFFLLYRYERFIAPLKRRRKKNPPTSHDGVRDADTIKQTADER